MKLQCCYHLFRAYPKTTTCSTLPVGVSIIGAQVHDIKQVANVLLGYVFFTTTALL